MKSENNLINNTNPEFNELPVGLREFVEAFKPRLYSNISFFLLDKDKFIYLSPCFKKLLGSEYRLLTKDRWNFWFSKIDKEDRKRVKNNLGYLFTKANDQNSFVLKYGLRLLDTTFILRHELFFYKIANQTLVVSLFYDISDKEKLKSKLRCFDRRNPSIRNSIEIPLVSPREKEVLVLIAKGYSSKQIAGKLFISNHTVISHRKQLIVKFQAKNTAQLIHNAYTVLEL